MGKNRKETLRRNSIEREAKKELKSARRILPEQEDAVSEHKDESFYDMNVKQRLSSLFRDPKERDGYDSDTIDISKKEDDVLLERPLPTTMAVDLIPIDRIVNGTVYTRDNRYLKIIEIMPINFLLKGEEEQEEVIYEFDKFLRVAPDCMQFKSIAKRTDISRYLAKIDEDIAKEENARCRNLLEDEKQLIYSIGATESVSRRFFLVIEYPGSSGRFFSEEEIESQLSSLKERAVSYIRQCGNTVLVMENNTEETARIYFDILNRRLNSSADFARRVSGVYGYYDANYGEKATRMIPIAEYFAPARAEIRHRDYIKLDDTYYTFLYVKSDGYPTEVQKGWLSLFVNAGEGIDVDLFTEKQNKSRYLERIGRHIRWNNSKVRDVSSSTSEYDDLSSAILSGFYLKSGLGSSQDFYYISMLLTISSDDLKELRRKKEEFETFLKSYDIETGDCDYEQKRALLSYLPLCRLDRKIYRRAKRNILTSGLSACYPFTSYEMCDEDGILFGTNEMNNSLCMVDIFNTRTYKNANIALMGTSGAGKTYTLQLIADRLRKKKIQVFIIAPDKGHEFKRACDLIGGEFIQVSPASRQCINVMEIRKRDTSDNEKLDGNMVQSLLALKIQSLHVFFSLLIPDMTAEEDQILDEVLLLVYGKKGITHDNESLTDPEDPERYREMPVLGDVYQELITRKGAGRVATILNRLVNGSASTFNQQTNVNLDNLYTIIDVSTLSGTLLTVGMYLALDLVYSKAKENRTKKKAIIIDETWELIGAKSNAKAAELVLEIFKVIRGYGGAAICATQDLNDFFSLEDGKYGKGIINNCKTKIILNLENKEARTVQGLLNLSEEEYKKIIRFERGHGLLSANGNNVPIHFKASELENAMFTTDRKELEQLSESGFFMQFLSE